MATAFVTRTWRGRRVTASLICILLGVAACAPEPRESGRFPVGVTTVSFLDKHGGRPLNAEVWYPAPDTTVEASQHYADTYLGVSNRDAPLRPGNHPLIVLAHGLRGSRYDLSWLAEGLAADGFIVAAVDHPGADPAHYVETEASRLWLRAHAMTEVIDGMLHHSRFAEQIDGQSIGAAGLSLGAAAALELGGARLNPRRFAHRFPEAGPIPRASQHDRRVHALVAIAPDSAPLFDANGLSGVEVPTLLISGETGDHPTPTGPLVQSLAHGEWHSIAAATQDSFRPACAWLARWHSGAQCGPLWPVNRADAQRQAVEWTRAFLWKNLSRHATAWN